MPPVFHPVNGHIQTRQTILSTFVLSAAYGNLNLVKPTNDKCSYHIETSQLILINCGEIQLPGFYMIRTLTFFGFILMSPTKKRVQMNTFI